jgi:sugar/nucleoside kinase (ribokinase family)
MKKTSAFFFIISIGIFLLNSYDSKPQKENKLPIKMKTDKLFLIGFGSPIVDAILNYESDPILAEELKLNMKYHLTKESSKELYYSAFDSQHSQILLGGSALNTVRIINYLLNVFFLNKIDENGYDSKKEVSAEFEVGYVGMIGKDKYGEYVKSKLDKENVKFLGWELEDKKTSTAIVLIESRDRNIFAHISASNKISSEHINNYEDLIGKSKIFYADSYLIKYSFSAYEYVFKNFANSDLLLALSLSNESLIEDNYDKFVQLFPYVDIFIGNSEEFQIIKKLMGYENIEISEFFEIFSDKFQKTNKLKKRIIVNTRGENSTLIFALDYVENSKELLEVPLFNVDDSLIMDLNGAGDGFAGGFFTGILLNMNLYQSGLLGNKIASEIIKLKGFQLPYKINIEDFKDFFTLNDSEKNKNSFTQKSDL